MKVVQNGSKKAGLSCKMVTLMCAQLGMKVINRTEGMKLRLFIHKTDSRTFNLLLMTLGIRRNLHNGVVTKLSEGV